VYHVWRIELIFHPQRVHVLYEHGRDKRPFGSASIRLLRPLSYPPLQDQLECTFGKTYDGQSVDVVILDRLWRADATFMQMEKLVGSVKKSRAKLVYALDDNFLEMPANQQNQLTEENKRIVQFLLSQADQVWVTTGPLKERFAEYSSQIVVIPNTLDERLLVPRFQSSLRSVFSQKRLVIGMMGTYTHDDDLLMILPALRGIYSRYPDQVEFQFVGAILRDETRDQLEGLPVNLLRTGGDEAEYPLFMLWFTGHVRWDIAISPLQATPFNRYKSDIKYLDYCAIGAAGVFTRSTAYIDSVQDRATGMLVDNQPDLWYQVLEELIEDTSLRETIAREGTNYLYAERILAHRYQDWISALQSV
jgi:glycosyltransferase involved in cell wall biosynthesis